MNNKYYFMIIIGFNKEKNIYVKLKIFFENLVLCENCQKKIIIIFPFKGLVIFKILKLVMKKLFWIIDWNIKMFEIEKINKYIKFIIIRYKNKYTIHCFSLFIYSFIQLQ